MTEPSWKRIELHLHLEGAVTVGDALLLASKNKIAGIDDEKVRNLFVHGCLDEFLRHFGAVVGFLRSADDVVWLLNRLLKRLSRQRVAYAEIRVSPSVWERHGIDPEESLRALCSARLGAFTSHQFIVDGVRQWDKGLLERDLRLALGYRKRGVSGIGLGGDEKAAPAKLFSWLSDACEAERLPLLVHAGEASGPEEVADAIDILRAKRIGHGVAAAADPALMARLAGQNVHLEICPSSNYATGAVPAGKPHPIGALVKNGVPCSISTDDPGLFSTSLAAEERLARRSGLSSAAIIGCRVAAANAALLPPNERKALAAMIM